MSGMTPQQNWDRTYERHAAALLLLARQYVRDVADAEDIVQEAFVAAWRARKTVRDLTAVLFASVRRCALQRLRSERRLKRREETAGSNQAAAFESSSGDQTDAIAALETLPEEQREVIVLKLWSELTFAQIGEVLDLPPETAASRYQTALENFGVYCASDEHGRA